MANAADYHGNELVYSLDIPVHQVVTFQTRTRLTTDATGHRGYVVKTGRKWAWVEVPGEKSVRLFKVRLDSVTWLYIEPYSKVTSEVHYK